MKSKDVFVTEHYLLRLKDLCDEYQKLRLCTKFVSASTLNSLDHSYKKTSVEYAETLMKMIGVTFHAYEVAKGKLTYEQIDKIAVENRGAFNQFRGLARIYPELKELFKIHKENWENKNEHF